jgi:hypothetical protein
MDWCHAKAQRRKGIKKKKGNFGASFSNSATPLKEFYYGSLERMSEKF